MSPLRAGGAIRGVSAERLDSAALALSAAVDAGADQLPLGERRLAEAVLAKVDERTRLVGGHTVVALAGATGSGKSALFNALVGEEVASSGVRRPTTRSATAAIWGEAPSGELLDWLGIKNRHLVAAADGGAQVGGLDGLILVDLPDTDSREMSHRVESDRLLDLVDLFVWVTDPQKYADARLHDDHIAALSTHEAVTLVVLNQSDRLGAEDVQRCREDLSRLMKRDGVPRVSVLATSAWTGDGMDELRQRLANAVAGRSAARARLAADLRAVAGTLSGSVGAGESRVDRGARQDLVESLARAAGVPVVVDAVTRDYALVAASRTGWPFSRWVHRLRPRPLRRLRLDGEEIRVQESDVRSVLGRSSLPPPSPAARSAVALATRRVADQAAAELPPLWADAVRDLSGPDDADLGDALDRAIVGTSVHTGAPRWWQVVNLLQVLLALTTVVGALWLALYVVLGWLQLDTIVPAPPTVGVVPVPVLCLVGGVVLGLVVAGLSRLAARVGARRRGRAVEKRLHASIAHVAEEEILDPVRRVLERHAACREALSRAAAV